MQPRQPQQNRCGGLRPPRPQRGAAACGRRPPLWVPILLGLPWLHELLLGPLLGLLTGLLLGLTLALLRGLMLRLLLGLLDCTIHALVMRPSCAHGRFARR